MGDESNKGMSEPSGFSRRSFLGMAGVTVAASVLPGYAQSSTASTASKPSAAPAIGKAGSSPNILFIFTDQERFSPSLHETLGLSAHQRLMAGGTTFQNHYCPAVMCTSSRAVLLTGLQTADNGMFENVDMPYVKPLATTTPTIGHMLRRHGYYTAYKGKWHLNRSFETATPERLFTQEMDAYGFSDFVWPGDVLTHTLGGYKNDHMIAGSAISWLRGTGKDLTEAGKPWSLFVSLVSPHDIMYFNTDTGSEQVQDNGRLMMKSSRAPRHPLYEKRWGLPLAATRYQSLTGSDRPRAHAEFDRAWGYTLGRIPDEDARWQRFNDFYYNSLVSVDAQLNRILDELEMLGLDQNTIVVFTSDHGEMGGAHGLRGKGPFAYEESIHVPLIIRHPDVQGGRRCQSLTSHIDIAPTLLSLCGVVAGKVADVADRELPGRDISRALNNVPASGLHTVRDKVLFTYSGIATNDSELMRVISEGKTRGLAPQAAMKAAGYRPNLKKRGSLRTVFDGRHKFTRYFAPVERNTPTTLEALKRWNDLELFDLQADPLEKVNLAATGAAGDELLLALNQKLNTAIAAEMGADDGREMPEFEGIDWAVSSIDL